MKAKIDLITIWTEKIDAMKKFYDDVLGFSVINDLGDYVEFKSEGVRFAVCSRGVMHDYSDEFKKKSKGQAFELAFPCESAEDVDRSYREIISEGATPVQEPQDMPWDQRTALFADPEDNIHELFAELSE